MPTKPKSALPRPAATLPGEADFLANVLANLADDNAKLVYADWLQERDDPRGPLLREFITAYRAGQKLPPVDSTPQSWRDQVGITLMRELQAEKLAPHTDQLLGLARPALAYTSEKASEKSLPIGASKFGGRPDMPEEIEWPRFEEQPLSFLGQFNLGELHASPAARDLPESGILSVFCHYEEGSGNDDFPDGSWRLFYFPDLSKLVRHELDAELPDESRFPSCRLEFREVLSLPSLESPWREDLRAGGTSLSAAYRALYRNVRQYDTLLGYPVPIQVDPLHKKSVRHLLTIGEDENTGWAWGDGGSLYFMLEEDDLRQRKFDRVRMEMDCG